MAKSTPAEQAEAEERGDAPAPEPVQMLTLADAQKMAGQAAEDAVQRVLSAMAAKSAEATPTPAAMAGNEMLAFIQQLAKSIAEVGNQGTGKVVIDPSVVQKREDARLLMMTLIAEAWRDQTKPEYELSGKVHLADQMIEPLWTDALKKTHRTKVVWYGPPNKAMSPVPGNVAAEAIHAAMREWIGQAPGVVAHIRQVDPKGRLVTPGGNVFQDLEPIPKDFGRHVLVIEEGARPPQEVPHNGLEIAGRGPSGQTFKTQEVSILGTNVPPARQLVA